MATTPNNNITTPSLEVTNPLLLCLLSSGNSTEAKEHPFFADEKILLKTISAKKRKFSSAIKVLDPDDDSTDITNPISFEELNHLVSIVNFQQLLPIDNDNNNNKTGEKRNLAYVEHMHPLLRCMVPFICNEKPHDNFVYECITLKSRTKQQQRRDKGVSPIMNLLLSESDNTESKEVKEKKKKNDTVDANVNVHVDKNQPSDHSPKKEEKIRIEQEKGEVTDNNTQGKPDESPTNSTNPALFEEMNPLLYQIGIPSKTIYNANVPAGNSIVVVVNDKFSNQRKERTSSSPPGLLNPDGEVNVIKSNPVIFEEINLDLISAVFAASAEKEQKEKAASMAMKKQPILKEEGKKKNIKQQQQKEVPPTAEKIPVEKKVGDICEIKIEGAPTVTPSPKINEPAKTQGKEVEPKTNEPAKPEVKEAEPEITEPAKPEVEKTEPEITEPVESEGEEAELKITEPAEPKVEVAKPEPEIEEAKPEIIESAEPEVEETELEITESAETEFEETEPKINKPAVGDEKLSEEQIVARVEMISRNLITVKDQTLVVTKSRTAESEQKHLDHDDAVEEKDLPSKEVGHKSSKGTILRKSAGVEETKEEETPTPQLEEFAPKEPMTFAKMVSKAKSNPKQEPITPVEKQNFEEQIIIIPSKQEHKSKPPDNNILTSQNLYMGAPLGVEETKFEDVVTHIPAPATFEELMGKKIEAPGGVEETKFDEMVVTTHNNIPTPATFEELMPITNAIIEANLSLEDSFIQPKEVSSPPPLLSYAAAIARGNARKENGISYGFHNNPASFSITKAKERYMKASSSDERIPLKNTKPIFMTKSNVPENSSGKNLNSKPLNKKKHEVVSKDTATGGETTDEKTMLVKDAENCSEKDASEDFVNEDVEVFDEEIIIGEWEEIIGEDLQMKITSSWSSEKQISCKPQDAVLVDFIGRLSPKKESNKLDDYDNKNDGEIFQNVQDWWITVGEKQVNPALEMGIRFLRTGQTAMIWSNSKYAFGPSDRIASSGFAKVPANANVSYAVTVRKIASQEELENPSFQIQMARSHKLIADDIFAHEKSPCGQYRALAIYHKISNSMISLAYNTDNAEEAKEILLDCLNNIVAVHLRMKEYKLAKESSAQVLLYDKTNTKGLIRAAKVAILDPDGTYEEALAAIESAEKIMGRNNPDVKYLHSLMKQSSLVDATKKNEEVEQPQEEENDKQNKNITKKESEVAPSTKMENNAPTTKSKGKKKKKAKKTTSTTTTTTSSSSRGIGDNTPAAFKQKQESGFETKLFPIVVASLAVVVAAEFFSRS